MRSVTGCHIKSSQGKEQKKKHWTAAGKEACIPMPLMLCGCHTAAGWHLKRWGCPCLYFFITCQKTSNAELVSALDSSLFKSAKYSFSKAVRLVEFKARWPCRQTRQRAFSDRFLLSLVNDYIYSPPFEKI